MGMQQWLGMCGRGLRNFTLSIAVCFGMGFLVAFAAGITAKLDTNDGTTAFRVQDSDGNDILYIGSDGSVDIKGKLSVNGHPVGSSVFWPLGTDGELVTFAVDNMGMNYTVPAGKVLCLMQGTAVHPNGLNVSGQTEKPIMIVAGTVLTGTAAAASACSGMLVDENPEITPLVMPFDGPPDTNYDYTVPAGKVIVVTHRSGSDQFSVGGINYYNVPVSFPAGSFLDGADGGMPGSSYNFGAYLINE